MYTVDIVVKDRVWYITSTQYILGYIINRDRFSVT
jgi:hypothetical protein